ncbi:hypothetical protein ACW7GZ_12470 [Luteimonas sp. A537]
MILLVPVLWISVVVLATHDTNFTNKRNSPMTQQTLRETWRHHSLTSRLISYDLRLFAKDVRRDHYLWEDDYSLPADFGHGIDYEFWVFGDAKSQEHFDAIVRYGLRMTADHAGYHQNAMGAKSAIALVSLVEALVLAITPAAVVAWIRSKPADRTNRQLAPL